MSGGHTSIDELLDRAVAAINRGDRATANALAGQVLAVDSENPDAEDLLAAPAADGEIRRLTILFADLVDSTVLSTRVEPETYRLLVSRYRDLVVATVNRFEGHVGSTKGDGLLAVFGHPIAHEDDLRRAVLAGLEITREIAKLSVQAESRFGLPVNVRVGIHRGLVYLDTGQDDVYGLAANLAARVSSLALPGTVVVSDAVAQLVRNDFALAPQPATAVKGIDEPIAHHQVLSERIRPARVRQGPLVGRDHELAQLRRAWELSQAGGSSVPAVAICGEPGIGKSRLASAVADLVEESGGVVVELTGSPFHTDVGLYPVRALLEHRCGIDRFTHPADRLRLLEAALRSGSLDPAALVPLLAPVLAIGAEAGYEPIAAEGDELYKLIGEAVQSYLLACMGGVGLVVAEDVHWFDPSTIEVLGALLNKTGRRPLVVVTGRPGDWLPDGWPVEVIHLAPLTDGQTDELISALNPDMPAHDRDAVRVRCDGVPFYIEQVVAGVAAAEGGPVVPEALYEPLFARLGASAKVVPVAEAAAVIGRDVERRLLGAVCALSDDQIDHVTDELVDALVLEPSGADSWRFRHELLREVAIEVAPPSVRRDLHSRVADALVAGGGDPDWRLVASHYEQAGRLHQAATAYWEASTAACRRGALTEACGHLSRALAGIEDDTPDPERERFEMSLHLRRGSLLSAAGDRAFFEDFERCLQLGGTDLEDDELVATLFAMVSIYNIRADLLRCVQVLETIRAGRSEGREWLRYTVDANLAIVGWLRGEFSSAGPALETAAERPPDTEHVLDAARYFPSDTYCAAVLHLALIRVFGGDLSAAEGELARIARRAERLAFPQGPFVRAFGQFIESWICVEAGQLGRAAEVIAVMLEQSERHGLAFFRSFGRTQQAAVDALTALEVEDPDPTELTSHIAKLASLLDNSHTINRIIYGSPDASVGLSGWFGIGEVEGWKAFLLLSAIVARCRRAGGAESATSGKGHRAVLW